MTTLFKSRYIDPAFQDRGFVNHIHHVNKDMGVHPGTTVPLIEAYKLEMMQKPATTSGTGGKPRNLVLFRKVLGGDPLTGTWHKIMMWSEGIDYDESSAAGSVDVDTVTGTVHVVMSFGKKNASGAIAYQPWEAFVARTIFAPPIERIGLPHAPHAPQTGAMRLLPEPRRNDAWHARPMAAGEGVLVNIPALFGVPAAAVYKVRLSVQAGAAGVTARVGTREAPYFLTATCAAKDIRMDCQGDVPGRDTWVSCVGGLGLIWLQVVGVG